LLSATIRSINSDKGKRVETMRISGITIQNDKNIEIGLTAVYGIGRPRARRIATDLGIDPLKKIKDLSPEEENEIRKKIEAFKIEGDLKREISMNIKRLRDIHSYRGIRHAKKLPVRGQRTRTNSRTVRGNVRKTMGSGRRKAEKK